MFDNLRWKFVLIISIFAMIVSIISGGLHGIRFGVILARAVAGGIVFGIFAVLLNLIVIKYFPELLEDSTGGMPEVSQEDAPGSNIDITVSSEIPDEPGSVMENLNNENTVDSPEQSGESTGNSEPGAFTDDQVPGDIDKYSGTFEDTGTEVVSGRESRGSGGVAAEFENDPEQLAKAIQTVISRDEKG